MVHRRNIVAKVSKKYNKRSLGEIDEAVIAPTLETESEHKKYDKMRKTPWNLIFKGLIFPIFFVTMFAACYLSAFAHPTPHNVPITISAPQNASAIGAQIQTKVGNSFKIATTSDTNSVLGQLKDGTTRGVLELDATPTLYVASGAGSSVTSAVKSFAKQITDAQGLKLEVKDLYPISSGDPTGTSVFYFVIITSIGGYLTATVLAQIGPFMNKRRRFIALGAIAIIAPAILFGIGQGLLGLFDGLESSLPALFLLGAANIFIVGTFAAFINRLFGAAGTLIVMTFIVFLNFPSAGGAIPVDLLPPFWQFLHSFWIGAAGVDTARSILYFDGVGILKPILVLLGWFAVALVGYLVVDTMKGKKELANPAAAVKASAAAAM